MSVSDQSKEGSRGGHVIGHTGNGVPIYAPKITASGRGGLHPQSHKEASIKKLSRQDHIDAIHFHNEQTDVNHKAVKELPPGPARDHHIEMREKHAQAASNHHIEAYGSRKLGQYPGYAPTETRGRGRMLEKPSSALIKKYQALNDNDTKARAHQKSVKDVMDLVKGTLTAPEGDNRAVLA